MSHTPLQRDGVDLVFPVEGQFLQREHAQDLRDALCAHWPDLAHTDGVGIHSIKVVPGTEPRAMLSHRARLLVRVPSVLAQALLASPAPTLQVGTDTLHLGPPHRRELLPHATLYAYHVAADAEDEPAFLARVVQDLANLGVSGECVCGKYHARHIGADVVHTYSLMLHALKPQPSLDLQQHGLGPHRLLGCGLFVPHKSAAAV